MKKFDTSSWIHHPLTCAATLLGTFAILTACSISKPCSEGGDVTWTPAIVGNKKCTIHENKAGKKVLDGPFKQEYEKTHTLALEGQYENGRKSGIWLFYGEDTKLKAVKFFDNGVEKTPPPVVQKKMDLIILQKNGGIIDSIKR